MNYRSEGISVDQSRPVQDADFAEALKRLDRTGRHVYARRDLAKLLQPMNERALTTALERYQRQGLIKKASYGVYVFAFSEHLGKSTLEAIVNTVRRGEYNYVSLESALAMHGVISQMPMDRLTVMTSGRSGEIKTPYGTIEFIHTKKAHHKIVEGCMDPAKPLPVADQQTALRDLRRVGRNLALIQDEEIRYGKG